MLANAKAGAWYTIGAQYAAMDKRWIVAGDAECLLPRASVPSSVKC